MNNDIFESAFSAIDDEFIAEAKSPAIRIAARRKKIIISAVAACIAAVLVAIPSVKVIGDMNDNKFTTSDDIEVITEYETIYENTSSEQAQSEDTQNQSQGTDSNPDNSILSGTTGTPNSNSVGLGDLGIKIEVDDMYIINNEATSTTTYSKVYVPNTDYLYINPIPTDKSVTIYQKHYENTTNEAEACALAAKFFPKLANALGIATPKYSVQTPSNSIYIQSTYEEDWPYRLVVSQSFYRNLIGFGTATDTTTIYGETVAVNLPQSDAEIINSLSSIKENLFNLFEVSFDSSKVIREYGDSDATAINVCFYNSSGHPLNNLKNDWPHSDFISLTFINMGNQTKVYSLTSLYYATYRTSIKSDLIPIHQMGLIPLEKAEEYLNKGYVLTVGSCSLCQSEQKTPVDFTDYDYVSLEYEGGNNLGDLTIPFYAFYKNIGTAENGNMTFAKTYVPAVEVEGYEEYFENKHANHNN